MVISGEGGQVAKSKKKKMKHSMYEICILTQYEILKYIPAISFYFLHLEK